VGCDRPTALGVQIACECVVVVAGALLEHLDLTDVVLVGARPTVHVRPNSPRPPVILDGEPERLPALIADVRLVKVERGPHNIAWTHPEEVNRALLTFLAEQGRRGREHRIAA
jgi:pimeloyl-ACP methyl ester carboxylesterase